MKTQLRVLSIFAMTAAALIQTSRAFAEIGIVVERESRKPIPDAIVVATWNGDRRFFAQARSACYKVEVARTDNRGKFSVSSFSGNLNPLLMDRSRDVVVLAPGYRMSSTNDLDSLDVSMEPQTGSNSERIKALPGTRATGCEGAGTNLLPYLELLHQQILSMATTKEERLLASEVRLSIEMFTLGPQQATDRYGQRRAEIMRNAP
jgi:hypothetical protein